MNRKQEDAIAQWLAFMVPLGLYVVVVGGLILAFDGAFSHPKNTIGAGLGLLSASVALGSLLRASTSR